MSEELLTEKYDNLLKGVLECYDRVIIVGHLGPLSYAQGMTNSLYGQQIRIFDYPQFAEPLRDEIKRTMTAARHATAIILKRLFESSNRCIR